MNRIFFLALTLAALPALTAPAGEKEKPAGKTETLWREWYLVTQKGSGVSFFEETAENRPGDHQLAITQKWVEKVGARSETYIGSVAEESNLTPVAFFVEHKGGKPYKTDARVKNNKLEITFKPGTPGLAKSTEFTPLQPGMFLSSFMALALSRHFGKTASNGLAFTAVVEDSGEMRVEVKKGSADLGSTEKKIGKETCRQAIVQVDGKVQDWWIAKSGKACLVEFPDTGTRMELSTEKLAKKTLKEFN